MYKNNLARESYHHLVALFSLFFLGLLLTITSSNALAHKVNIFAYAEGDMVYTESYFPDGRKVEGGTVEVYDSQENKLLEGKTDKEGQFNFKAPKKDDLKIVLIASMGHKNSYMLSAEELPDTVEAGGAEEQKPKPVKAEELREQESPAPETSVQVDINQIKSIIDSSLDEKLKPIMRQLAKTEQKEISFTEVIGGIGYIFGIIGIIMYFSSKKR